MKNKKIKYIPDTSKNIIEDASLRQTFYFDGHKFAVVKIEKVVNGKIKKIFFVIHWGSGLILSNTGILLKYKKELAIERLQSMCKDRLNTTIANAKIINN